jgi:hypothetical protein
MYHSLKLCYEKKLVMIAVKNEADIHEMHPSMYTPCGRLLLVSEEDVA